MSKETRHRIANMKREHDPLFYQPDYLPPTIPECPQDRDIQIDWLYAQVDRLPLTETEKQKYITSLCDLWDREKFTPAYFKIFVDLVVGEE